MKAAVSAIALASALSVTSASPLVKRTSDTPQKPFNVQVGIRPEWLVNDMDESELKEKLASCSEGPWSTTPYVMAHRGAPLEVPEHSKEGYIAARRMGAGIIECDVAFTKDLELVCRHDQCDMHYTTDVLTKPELAAKCTTPFTPSNGTSEATAQCCTSDFTLEEFKSVCAKMEATINPNATVLEDFLSTPVYRTDLYATCGTVLSQAEYIDLVDSFGLGFTTELKTPVVDMPFNGYTQEQYAQDMIDLFKAKGIDPSRVWAQSFLPDDIFYWIENEPDFGKQAVYLDERVDTPEGYDEAVASLADLKEKGVKIMAPAMFALTKLNADNTTIIPSEYAIEANRLGLDLVAWSFERSGFLNEGGGYYYDYVSSIINNDGDAYTVLDVLAQQVGIKHIFSDWPATATYYANCFGL